MPRAPIIHHGPSWFSSNSAVKFATRVTASNPDEAFLALIAVKGRNLTNLLINYADRAFYQAQKLNTQTGLGVGGFDGAIAFRRHHLDPMFVARNNRVLDCPTGAGWWLWKPCIVLASLHRALGEGDVLFYADSGCHFIGNAQPIIKLCQQRPDKPILLFSMRPDYLNRCFVKRDCFHYMGLDTPRFTDAIHTCASFFVCKDSLNGFIF